MKRSLVSIASTAGLLLLAGAPAWADPTVTDVQWTYSFTPAQDFVSSNTGTGSLTFTSQPINGATNNSDVVLTNLKVSSTAPESSPDRFNNAAWNGKLTLTDVKSGVSHDMTFSGQLGGFFSATNANVTNQFTGTTSYNWVAPNGTHYTVTVGNYTPPGPPSSNNAGSISVHVSVDPGPASPGHAPEPSTLLLSCLGLGFASAASWRKRRALAAKSA